MKQLEIREAKRADKKDILKLIESWKPYHWDAEPANKHFTRFFESNDFPQDKFFVGLMDNRIVSVIGYCPDRFNKIGIYCLGWFYTHKDYSRLGIGQRMFDFVISELKAKKARKLFVNTSSDDFYTPAVNLYLRMGFKQEGALEDFYEKGENRLIFGMYL